MDVCLPKPFCDLTGLITLSQNKINLVVRVKNKDLIQVGKHLLDFSFVVVRGTLVWKSYGHDWKKCWLLYILDRKSPFSTTFCWLTLWWCCHFKSVSWYLFFWSQHTHTSNGHKRGFTLECSHLGAFAAVTDAVVLFGKASFFKMFLPFLHARCGWSLYYVYVWSDL